MPVDLVAPPVLVTVPQVELIHAGQWEISTGTWDVTPADLAAAIAALDCPAVHSPVIKIGHTDRRFDGEPAVGYVANMAVSARGSELVGDLAGLPAWLGKKDEAGQSVLASAYPNRSVEGEYDYTCQLGHSHPFVLTGLALLGVTPPGIGTLESLSDVAALYGVAASSVVAAARALEENMPSPKVAAAATVEDVRRSFYEGPAAAKWWWIEELYVDPSEAIVVDDDTGELYRITYSVDAAGEVTWGEPQTVKRTYVAASSALRTPVSAWASKAESRPNGPQGKAPRAADRTVTAPTDPPAAPAVEDTPQKDGGSPPMPMQLSDEQAASLRAQYGLPETATLEEILGAALTGQAPATPPATDPATPPAGTQTPATPATPAVPAGQTVPEGAVLVDAEQWRETQVAAADGRAARQRQISEDRDRIVSAAVSEGRIPPSRSEHWRRMLDVDPEGTPAVLASFQVGASVPTVPLGHSGTELAGAQEAGPEDNYGYLTGVPLVPTGGN